MNDEQNTSENSFETNGDNGNESTATGSTAQSVPASDNANAEEQDSYYDVDYSKKDVLSTIGDGEMHDEGLVGAGEATSDIQSSTERMSDEQDAAESHDSEQ